MDGEVTHGELTTGEDLPHYYHVSCNFTKSCKNMTLNVEVICYNAETAMLVAHDELVMMGVEPHRITMMHVTKGEADYS